MIGNKGEELSMAIKLKTDVIKFEELQFLVAIFVLLNFFVKLLNSNILKAKVEKFYFF
jgi:hypothetical protein